MIRNVDNKNVFTSARRGCQPAGPDGWVTGSHCFLHQAVTLLCKPPWRLQVCLKQGTVILTTTSSWWSVDLKLSSKSERAELWLLAGTFPSFLCFIKFLLLSSSWTTGGIHYNYFFTRNYEANIAFLKGKKETTSRAGKVSSPVFCLVG